MEIRALSYNIHKGFSATRKLTLARIREALRETNASVLFLQEIVGEHEKHRGRYSGWPDASQFEYLADTLWPHHAYGKNAVYDEGHHGNAILSKYPIVAWENIDLSTHRMDHRGLLHAQILLPDGRTCECLCTHFGLLRVSRVTQVRRLVEFAARALPPEAPIILGGDFNDWRGDVSAALSRELGFLDALKLVNGAPVATFPSQLPVLALDRIFTRGVSVSSGGVLTGRLWRALSDHLPVVADVVV